MAEICDFCLRDLESHEKRWPVHNHEFMSIMTECEQCHSKRTVKQSPVFRLKVRVSELTAENARLRRQVERLKQWEAAFRDGYLCGLMEKVPQDVGCFDHDEMEWSWINSTAKKQRDAILADEPGEETP